MNREDLRDFSRALQPGAEILDTDDDRYQPNLHGEGPDDVVEQLQYKILTSAENGSHLYYFTGQRGTGKSTELRRLEIQLAGEGVQAIRFDALDVIVETEPISVESLLLLVAAGVAQWTDTNFREDFVKAGAWERFRYWLETEVKLTDVTVQGLKLSLREQQASVKEAIRTLSSRLDWNKVVRDYIGEIVEFIRDRSGRARVVVIVDSLERLRGVSENDKRAMTDSVVDTFSGVFARLRIPGASVVYSVPPYLPLLADVRNFVDCYSLAAVRVYECPIQKDGQLAVAKRHRPRPAGLAKMRGLVERRYGRWNEALSPEALDRIALACGGDLRHFLFRMLPEIAFRASFALDDLPLKMDHALIDNLLRVNQGETERLTVQDEWPMLRDIARSHQAIAKDRGPAFHAMANLFGTRVILNYRNGEEWFDVHPLLRPLMEKLEADELAAGTDAA